MKETITFLEKKSLEIKDLISVYTKESFICFFADFIRNYPNRTALGFSSKLKSKNRDSLYLIALRLSDDRNGDKVLTASLSNNIVLEKVGDKLIEIMGAYLYYNKDYLNGVNEKNKLFIHEATFRNYFQNGKLNYRQQEVNHVRKMFEPYKSIISKRLNIELETLIDICDYSEKLYIEKSIKNHSFLTSREFQKAASILAKSEIKGEELSEELDKLPQSFFDFAEEPHKSFLFTKKDFYKKFVSKDIDIFCELFTLDINEKINYLFYTQKNPLDERPIIKLNESEYIHIFQKQLPSALYILLYKTLSQTKKEATRLNFRRGKKVFENQVGELLVNFFRKDKNYKIYRNYYVEGDVKEKDILVVSKYYAFVIECKSSKFREPLRDVDVAFLKIKKDFDTCIQKGYDQCFFVEQKCLETKGYYIEVNNRRKRVFIDTSFLIDVFSIVVTLERFGPIQTNLELLLKKENVDDLYPWSVSIDDMEIFLLTMRKTENNPIKCFIDYLTYREELQGKIMTIDELDICSLFLQNKIKFKNFSKIKEYLLLDPKLQDYFDNLYYAKKLKFY